MACPGGCLGGGGVPIPTSPEIRAARARAIYSEDSSYQVRKSHENPAIARLYKEFLTDGPCGHTSHHLLHTHYAPSGTYLDWSGGPPPRPSVAGGSAGLHPAPRRRSPLRAPTFAGCEVRLAHFSGGPDPAPRFISCPVPRLPPLRSRSAHRRISVEFVRSFTSRGGSLDPEGVFSRPSRLLPRRRPRLTPAAPTDE
jgi:hypothetical protein